MSGRWRDSIERIIAMSIITTRASVIFASRTLILPQDTGVAQLIERPCAFRGRCARDVIEVSLVGDAPLACTLCKVARYG
jgi:hypothetical protein